MPLIPNKNLIQKTIVSIFLLLLLLILPDITVVLLAKIINDDLVQNTVLRVSTMSNYQSAAMVARDLQKQISSTNNMIHDFQIRVTSFYSPGNEQPYTAGLPSCIKVVQPIPGCVTVQGVMVVQLPISIPGCRNTVTLQSISQLPIMSPSPSTAKLLHPLDFTPY